MAKICCLANEVLAEINAKIFEHPYILNFLYYTGKDSCNQDIADMEKPYVSELINKNYIIGRRVRYAVTEVGAYICTRVARYSPQFIKSKLLIKEVEVDIDILVHDDCQSTIYGTRDLVLLSLIQEALEENGLNGISPNCEFTNVSDIPGLPPNFSGYCLTVRIKGFNKEFNNGIN